VVVLVNENSASAAEILAIVLKEKQGAILVGQQTYGKGTVQELVDYGDGSSLKLTIAEWRSPKYHSINGIGIKPHEIVEYTLEDVQNGVDPQLEKALEVIQREIEEKEAEVTAGEEAEGAEA
jgi:carboxyl-terminal processing protease